ncbi:MAG: LpxL/LpxP family acyltransferase [Bordetella sp.]|uniref:LpxL/LpxP family acyltransferase n=1 Tax=Bordetella sp. TaxID=28081 RepID=UPI003F7C92DC
MTRPDDTHWANQPERGSDLLMRLTARATRLLGRRTLTPVVWLIVLYFYVTGRRARRAVADYQRRLAAHTGRDDLFPARCAVYRQFLMFAQVLLDKLDAWQGKITLRDLDLDDPDGLLAQMKPDRARGQILLCAHMGNLDVCRALAAHQPSMKLTVLVHSHNAVRFNQVLAEAGATSVELMQVSELDAIAMLDLSQRIDRGEWLAITGDRVPPRGNRVVEVDFLGAPARFPQGPWLLAGILRCPVNILSCARQEQGPRVGRYKLAMRRLAVDLAWTRATRDDAIRRVAQRYADELALACRETPLQWFNFYPFWNDHA